MKILQLISSAGFFGAENVVLQLSTELTALGHSVTVGVFHDGRGANSELPERTRAFSLVVQPFECVGRWDRSTVNLIATYVNNNHIQLIHSHGYKADFYARAAGRKGEVRLVSTCHNWIDSSVKMRVYNMIDRLVLRDFGAVVAVSAAVRDKLLHSGIANDKVLLIRNGVDASKFGGAMDVLEIRREFGFGATDKIIGAVGRLSREKGHSDLLQACERILTHEPNSRLLIVGDGPLRGELVRKAKALGLDQRVVFAGQRQDVAKLLSAMDVFVLPSLTEGQPMALLEAMAAGRAIVATAVGDVPAILKGGDAGILVAPGDTIGMADGILRLLRDASQASAYSRRAKTEVIEHYSSAAMAKEYLKVYGAALTGTALDAVGSKCSKAIGNHFENRR